MSNALNVRRLFGQLEGQDGSLLVNITRQLSEVVVDIENRLTGLERTVERLEQNLTQLQNRR